MLESLNYSFRNPKKHNLSNLPHQTVEKLQKKHGVLRGSQLGKQRWRPRLGILRVNVVSRLGLTRGTERFQCGRVFEAARPHKRDFCDQYAEWRWEIELLAELKAFLYDREKGRICLTAKIKGYHLGKDTNQQCFHIHVHDKLWFVYLEVKQDLQWPRI